MAGCVDEFRNWRTSTSAFALRTPFASDDASSLAWQRT